MAIPRPDVLDLFTDSFDLLTAGGVGLTDSAGFYVDLSPPASRLLLGAGMPPPNNMLSRSFSKFPLLRPAYKPYLLCNYSDTHRLVLPNHLRYAILPLTLCS